MRCSLANDQPRPLQWIAPTIFGAALLCAATLAPTSLQGAETVYVQIHTNNETQYTNYRFAAADRGQQFNWALYEAKVEWDVIDVVGKPKKHIIVHQSPDARSLSANAEIHKALMTKILSRWPISQFDSISFGRLGRPPDWSWSIAIAVASSKSADYKDYKAHYPNSKITGLNGLYRDLAQQSGAGRPLREFFKQFDADLQYEGGEKVIDAKAGTLPFYPQLKAAGVTGQTRVIYDAGGNGFAIKARSAPASATRASH
jgi:hypothetical protein